MSKVKAVHHLISDNAWLLMTTFEWRIDEKMQNLTFHHFKFLKIIHCVRTDRKNREGC